MSLVNSFTKLNSDLILTKMITGSIEFAKHSCFKEFEMDDDICVQTLQINFVH